MTGFYREISENLLFFYLFVIKIQKVFSHLEQVSALLGLQLEVEGVSDSDGGGGPALVLDQESNPGNIIDYLLLFLDYPSRTCYPGCVPPAGTQWEWAVQI